MMDNMNGILRVWVH